MDALVATSVAKQQSLEGYDIALANLEQAVGLPGTEHFNIPQCLRWIDKAAEVTKQKTNRHFHHFFNDPGKFDNSEAVA